MAKVEVDSNAKKTLESTKNTEKSEADKSTKKNVAGVNLFLFHFLIHSADIL